ncbi:MAG: hypothetical protein ACKOAU_09970 [Pirellula sp.]
MISHRTSRRIDRLWSRNGIVDQDVFFNWLSIQEPMLRWLIVLLLSMTVALGPSFCCCSLRAAAMYFGPSDRSSLMTEQSSDDCCTIDAQGVPACCKKPKRSDSGGPEKLSKSTKDCCGKSNACRCLPTVQSVILPSDALSKFELVLYQMTLVNRFNSSLARYPGKIGAWDRATIAACPLGSCARAAFQRWNC